jgi:hypothetical protein
MAMMTAAAIATAFTFTAVACPVRSCVRGGHLLPGGHVLVSAKRAEHVRNHARLRAGSEEAGFDAVKLMLLAVIEAHYLLICGLPGTWKRAAKASRGLGAGPRRARSR